MVLVLVHPWICSRSPPGATFRRYSLGGDTQSWVDVRPRDGPLWYQQALGGCDLSLLTSSPPQGLVGAPLEGVHSLTDTCPEAVRAALCPVPWAVLRHGRTLSCWNCPQTMVFKTRLLVHSPPALRAWAYSLSWSYLGTLQACHHSSTLGHPVAKKTTGLKVGPGFQKLMGLKGEEMPHVRGQNDMHLAGGSGFTAASLVRSMIQLSSGQALSSLIHNSPIRSRNEGSRRPSDMSKVP